MKHFDQKVADTFPTLFEENTGTVRNLLTSPKCNFSHQDYINMSKGTWHLIIIGDAITCMDWNSSYQMNFAKKAFEEKATLHSACQQ